MNTIFTEHLLSIMIAIPFLGIAIIAFIQDQEWIRRVAFGCTLGDGALSLVLLKEFDFSFQGMQFVERMAWMPTFNIQYAVGVDGISLLLVLLTTLLCPFCVLCSWKSITTRVRSFMAMILLVEGAMIVVFTALDLFLFFMLWEVTMIPMYFMIILWGGPQRIAAGIKFVLYSLSGSLILLLAILGLYVEGGRTFDILALAENTYSPDAQFWIFLAFFLAFAIKLPMLPFHTWLPDAHSEAPTAGSVLLAGVLLKMGGYGFLRFCLPMFPEASVTFAPFILWLSVAAIVYGGYMALAQSDLKKLVAYSSISHMGFVTLGIFVFNNYGIQGAILQMVNHGITTGALFLAVGQLYDRTHSRSIQDYGGLQKSMPRFVALFCLFSVASFGLPGTCNFIGEFLVLVGTSFESYVMVLLSMGGIVLAAAYMLWMLQRVVLGQPKNSTIAQLPDLNMRELVTVMPLAVLILGIGLYPSPLMEMMDSSVTHLAQHMAQYQVGMIHEVSLR
ncbi:complex I subunit 4 family protein [Candidatus Nitrospira allomarina]|jgi:NADH-quinone oxidoreductase subunit M|uniref:NADH-quinone oxidoreductase subunit M n=1 Tax=Candidatus Nitrospira allomarina TaxID=3020900 RepID=A0AA96GCJ0_9BACT|nr:NADH-quinone oxidoreductase subunit M [Candidatus Nitrospira allomarina]WNM59273.1 NADH-quinone oxidoreductase subunit M [Candidatus Nitrospira allomarina]